MAARGNKAKENLINKIIESLPQGTYVGCYDKKYYFWSEEDGEKIQVAFSLTVPKNPVSKTTLPVNGGFDFSSGNQVLTTPEIKEKPEEISEEELDNIAALMKKLGL